MIFRFRDGVAWPSPGSISFGWTPNGLKLEDFKNQFLWTGMSDSYIAQITLGLALKVISF